MTQWSPEQGQFPSTIHPLNQAPWEVDYDPGTLAAEDIEAAARYDAQQLSSLSVADVAREHQRRKDDFARIGARLTAERIELKAQGKAVDLDVSDSDEFKNASERLERARTALYALTPEAGFNVID